MIVVDTSALMAILQNEAAADACAAILEIRTKLLISAGTLAEAAIVCGQRDLDRQLTDLLEETSMEVVPVTAARARQVSAAYRRWGKGYHPAKLNFGDCFAYALAVERDCPLLFVGNDFGQTDVVSALAA